MIKLVVCVFGAAVALMGQEREALAALEKAERLIDTSPAASLACAENAAASDWSRRKWFWPVMLQAQVKLGKWEAAVRLGSEAIQEIEAGRFFEHADEIGDEVRFRRWFAEALEHQNRGEEARSQRSMLETRAKAALLATETSVPAPAQLQFAEKYRGKIVIVIFWATWCAPCITELNQWNAAYPLLRDRAVALAADADDSAEAVKEFMAKRGYAFPTVVTHDAVSTIPQLFVLDREGVLRFHLAGFDDDGLFAKRLDWMITAALSSPARR